MTREEISRLEPGTQVDVTLLGERSGPYVFVRVQYTTENEELVYARSESNLLHVFTGERISLHASHDEAHRVERELAESNLRLRERLEVAHRQEEKLGDHNTELNRRVHMLEERLIVAGNKVTEMKAAIARGTSTPRDPEIREAITNLLLSGYQDEAKILRDTWKALERATGDAK